MADSLARSGNAAGYSGAMSSLDNSAAQTASDQARQNQIDFANEQERQKELGASGLTSLLGINTAAQLGTSGQAAGLASLGGGVDTTTAGGSNFSNQNFQATPDPSTTKTPTTTTSTPKAGTDANGKHPGDPGYDPTTDPGSEQYAGPNSTPPVNNDPNYHTDANGNHPGDPGYDPTTDRDSPQYIPPTEPGPDTPPPTDVPPGGGETTPTEPPPDTPPPDDGSDSLTVLKRLLMSK